MWEWTSTILFLLGFETSACRKTKQRYKHKERCSLFTIHWNNFKSSQDNSKPIARFWNKHKDKIAKKKINRPAHSRELEILSCPFNLSQILHTPKWIPQPLHKPGRSPPATQYSRFHSSNHLSLLKFLSYTSSRMCAQLGASQFHTTLMVIKFGTNYPYTFRLYQFSFYTYRYFNFISVLRSINPNLLYEWVKVTWHPK